MMPLVQQLGCLDVRLIQDDKRWCARVPHGLSSAEEGALLHEHIMLSYLWVLGAYEFVRTLCERVKADTGSADEVQTRLQEVKSRIGRVRVPLAKMVPASRYSSEDSAIAYPGMQESIGVAWQLSATTVISRRELSDALLEALEFRRSVFLQDQAARQQQEGET
jgi:hypothetical protein